MNRTIKVALKDFPSVPPSLFAQSSPPALAEEIEIDLGRLFHHFYLDTQGTPPPDPDAAQFHHLKLLAATTDFRARDQGFGSHAAYKGHVSNELGQAFCRWFLYDHLDITYFAHMEHVLDRGALEGSGNARVERVQKGDAPDYLCAGRTGELFLAEAKGRTSTVSFGNAEFKRWRKQFGRIVVRDESDVERAVKGFIVATRFSCEASPRVCSKLFAEDPKTRGDGPLRDDGSLLGTAKTLHYAGIAAKLRQPILSAALATGGLVPEEIIILGMVWELIMPPYQGRRFVGGYFPGPGGVQPIQNSDGKVVFLPENPLRLDYASGTFFGVEEHVFRAVCQAARTGSTQAVQPLEEPAFFYSAISFLRDGSIVGPVDFFRPQGQVAF
ncbi:hypothetical protein [Mesorhizobium delmotii]|uniref:Uncharacterized protein n=1 Tax=Mesorhizobium delmotii TaxID=1631247 RepID=A0A2P9ALG7_9HYPH|nr:hypothetical protein [Mesorhizobium delmotii]SJM31985.1 conserved hypothetical protein [Mesorhizobium delmotii]